MSVKHCTRTTLRNKLIKIGCKVVHHVRRVVFQLAEVAIPRSLFALILCRTERLRLRLLTRHLHDPDATQHFFRQTSTPLLSVRRNSAKHASRLPKPPKTTVKRQKILQKVNESSCGGGVCDGKLLTRGWRCLSAKVQLGNPG